MRTKWVLKPTTSPSILFLWEGKVPFEPACWRQRRAAIRRVIQMLVFWATDGETCWRRFQPPTFILCSLYNYLPNKHAIQYPNNIMPRTVRNPLIISLCKKQHKTCLVDGCDSSLGIIKLGLNCFFRLQEMLSVWCFCWWELIKYTLILHKVCLQHLCTSLLSSL